VHIQKGNFKRQVMLTICELLNRPEAVGAKISDPDAIRTKKCPLASGGNQP